MASRQVALAVSTELKIKISGFCSESYLPPNRGFDTFNGLYVGDEEDFNEERKNTKKGWRRLYKSNKHYNHDSMFDSVSYGEKISELLFQNQTKDRPFLIYFAPLTKVYPNQRNSFQEIILERRKKISQLDQAVDLVSWFVGFVGLQSDLFVIQIMKALVETGQYDNTVVLITFSTDSSLTPNIC